MSLQSDDFARSESSIVSGAEDTTSDLMFAPEAINELGADLDFCLKANSKSDSGSDFAMVSESKLVGTACTFSKLYWYSNSDSSEPIGPISKAEVQKHIALGLVNLFSVVW